MIGYIIINENNLSMHIQERKMYDSFAEAEFEAIRQVRDIIRHEVWNWKTYDSLSGQISMEISKNWRWYNGITYVKDITFMSKEYDENGFIKFEKTRVYIREVEC